MKTRSNRKTSVAFLFALMACAAGASAQATQPVAAGATTHPAQTPVLAANTVLRADVPYGGPDAALDVLDLYSPSGASAAPVLIFVHGGEWTKGDKQEISCKPKFFNEHGVIFISINYRLSPKDPHPAQVQDVATAIAWVHTHAREFGGDPGKIVIMGHSAGCHLVTLVSLDPQYLAKLGMKPADLRGVVAWSGGMYDLVARFNGGGTYPPYIKATFGESADAQRAGSPLTYVSHASACPPFLFASVDDAKSQTSRDAVAGMVDQIQKNGGHADSIILVGKSHFTANHELGAPGDQTGPQLLKFIQTVTQ